MAEESIGNGRPPGGESNGGNFGPPPVLEGYDFDSREAYGARDGGRLLVTRVESTRVCPLRCLYCRPDDGQARGGEISYGRLIDLTREACALGVRSMVLTGGEPTMLPRFGDLVDAIRGLGMVPVVFSNCLEMTPKLARFLYQRGASVMAKLDSLRPEVQDRLAGLPGSAERMRSGIENLLHAGFGGQNDSHRLRLGASFVACRSNLDEIEDIWRFCRSNGVLPHMEVPTASSGKKRLPVDEVLSKDEVRDRRLRLLELDRREYGYDWLPYTPIVASRCLQHFYSLHVTAEGDVRPCESVAFEAHPALRRDGVYPHNIHRCSLREIFSDPLFEQVRSIEEGLEGKCGSCEHGMDCIGCRGDAYAAGIEEGKGPLDALRGDCPRCLRP